MDVGEHSLYICWKRRCFLHSFIHSFMHSFIHSFIRSLFDSFIHSFIHSTLLRIFELNILIWKVTWFCVEISTNSHLYPKQKHEVPLNKIIKTLYTVLRAKKSFSFCACIFRAQMTPCLCIKKDSWEELSETIVSDSFLRLILTQT